LKAILFDLDGTLTDTLRLVLSSLGAALGPVWGEERSPDEIRRLLGPSELRILEQEAPGRPEVVEAFYRHYRARLHHDACVFHGVRPMLATLAERGWPLGLVTSKGARGTAITLEEFGLRRFFRAVVHGDEVRATKPDPEAIRLCLQRLLIPPEEAVYVGDQPTDLVAARAAGCGAWAAAWGHPPSAPQDWDCVALAPDDILHHCLRRAPPAR